eukprot:3635576-Prymnesium_polylepis.1
MVCGPPGSSTSGGCGCRMPFAPTTEHPGTSSTGEWHVVMQPHAGCTLGGIFRPMRYSTECSAATC